MQPGLELAVELNPRTDIEPAYDFTSHISRKALSIGRGQATVSWRREIAVLEFCRPSCFRTRMGKRFALSVTDDDGRVGRA